MIVLRAVLFTAAEHTSPTQTMWSTTNGKEEETIVILDLYSGLSET